MYTNCLGSIYFHARLTLGTHHTCLNHSRSGALEIQTPMMQPSLRDHRLPLSRRTPNHKSSINAPATRSPLMPSRPYKLGRIRVLANCTKCGRDGFEFSSWPAKLNSDGRCVSTPGRLLGDVLVAHFFSRSRGCRAFHRQEGRTFWVRSR